MKSLKIVLPLFVASCAVLTCSLSAEAAPTAQIGTLTPANGAIVIASPTYQEAIQTGTLTATGTDCEFK